MAHRKSQGMRSEALLSLEAAIKTRMVLKMARAITVTRSNE
jgi:hypothetical protein